MLSTTHHRIGGTLLGAFLAFTCVTPALADDSEIYVNSDTGANAVRPNILFIMDTSISMNDADVPNERTPYDYKKTYGTQGNCTGSRIFYRSEGRRAPDVQFDELHHGQHLRTTAATSCSRPSRVPRRSPDRWTGKTAMYDATNEDVG